eukprot:7314546-Alexandrium_andersonii.AAC.1
MSASLVGSEMCIRDRSSSCASPHGHAGRLAEPAADATRTRGARAAQPGDCLLYTSDAADDM